MNDWQMAQQILNPITPLARRVPTPAAVKRIGSDIEARKEILELHEDGLSVTAIMLAVGRRRQFVLDTLEGAE